MRAAILSICVVALVSAQEPAQRIDDLFSRFNGKFPGCAVGVTQDGRAVFAKGYGMADLEHDVPIAPASPFYMASVSKQFTAMSILLLVEDGKLQLSDPVRKFIPELPEYSSGITVRHLLNHTSGLRDYFTIAFLAGRPNETVYTDRSILRLLARQNAPNFAPGSEFSYSNSGYVLLSLIVKRVSQKSLNEFAQERIFVPLGMKSTRFQHNHSALIPGKVFGYGRSGAEWHTSNSMLDVVGDGGLYSTVDDMLRWFSNLDNPKVGGKALAVMQIPGRLNNGKETDYGMGLAASERNGLRMVEHSGGLAGYRTKVLWVPSKRFSVVCLCNTQTANPGQLANQVAELYLPEFKATPPAKPRPPSSVTLSPEELRANAGLYRNQERGYIELVERSGKLYTRGAPGELMALDHRRFTASDVPDGWGMDFDDQTPPRSFSLRLPKQPPVRYERAIPVTLNQTEGSAYTGEFECRELEATYRISTSPSGLQLEMGDRQPVPLQSAGSDHMRVEQGELELVFSRDSSGTVTGFHLNGAGLHNIQFRRM